jgi:hypothetical protein
VERANMSKMKQAETKAAFRHTVRPGVSSPIAADRAATGTEPLTPSSTTTPASVSPCMWAQPSI